MARAVSGRAKRHRRCTPALRARHATLARHGHTAAGMQEPRAQVTRLSVWQTRRAHAPWRDAKVRCEVGGVLAPAVRRPETQTGSCIADPAASP
eukprot:349682-Chlamydomonas_euryale.AAC.28